MSANVLLAQNKMRITGAYVGIIFQIQSACHCEEKNGKQIRFSSNALSRRGKIEAKLQKNCRLESAWNGLNDIYSQPWLTMALFSRFQFFSFQSGSSFLLTTHLINILDASALIFSTPSFSCFDLLLSSWFLWSQENQFEIEVNLLDYWKGLVDVEFNCVEWWNWWLSCELRAKYQKYAYETGVFCIEPTISGWTTFDSRPFKQQHREPIFSAYFVVFFQQK